MTKAGSCQPLIKDLEDEDEKQGVTSGPSIAKEMRKDAAVSDGFYRNLMAFLCKKWHAWMHWRIFSADKMFFCSQLSLEFRVTRSGALLPATSQWCAANVAPRAKTKGSSCSYVAKPAVKKHQKIGLKAPPNTFRALHSLLNRSPLALYQMDLSDEPRGFGKRLTCRAKLWREKRRRWLEHN